MEKMIISRRELAIALDKGPIELKIISKRLKNAINLWIKLKEIQNLRIYNYFNNN